MGGSVPKPLVNLAGKPIIAHLVDAVREAGVDEIALVVGSNESLLRELFGNSVKYVSQPEPLGTAHAVQCAIPLIEQFDTVMILVGDSPLLRPATLQHLLNIQLASGSEAAILTGNFKQHYPYARVIRDENQHFLRCVEERDATPTEKRIQEYMTSHFCFAVPGLLTNLPQLKPHPVTGEIYLTDLINLYAKNGKTVETIVVPDSIELVGLNTPEDVAWAEMVFARASFNRI